MNPMRFKVPTPRGKRIDGADHIDIVIGYPEHLDHVLDAPSDLNAKTTKHTS